VAVFRNAGGGNFLPEALYPTIPHSIDIIAADLDGDGDTDVAVAGSGASGAQILWGDGDGALVAGPGLPGATLSYAIAAADFDGDGDTDLAYDRGADQSILVLHRESNGQYSPPQRLFVGVFPKALAAGDWNGDGRPDLATAYIDGLLFVRPDIGQQIAPAATHVIGSALRSGDFNNDGHADLFVLIASDQSALYLGDGALGLWLSGFTMPGVVLHAVDFNGDGNLDVATWDATWLGNGQGGFTMSAPVGGPVVADFNVDGRPDVLTYSTDPFLGIFTLTVRLGDGAGGFGAPISTTMSIIMLVQAGPVVAGLFDGDNLPDVAFLILGNLRFLRGNGAGGFGTSTSVPGPSHNSGLTVGDFNDDGYSDILNNTAVKWGGPSGLTNGPTLAFGAGGYLADVNGDGVDDVASTSLTLGDRGGNLRQLHLFTGGGGAVIADWNGDGRADLARGGGTFEVKLFVAANCQARTLGLVSPPSTCNTPGAPFATQPVVAAMDVAGNVVCPAGAVSATLMPGTGTPGAVLGGTTTAPLVDGAATFTDLSVDQPGRRYRLSFDSPGLVPVTSPTFSQGLAPVVTGAPLACPGRPELYAVGQGYDSYEWRLDGTFQATSASVLLDLPTGPHTVDVTVEQDACSATDSLAVESAPPSIDVTVAGPTTVCPACTAGLLGANPVAATNAPLQWGYRLQSSGAITPLPGQTGTTYRLAGSDFPGPGAYFVVASVDCGSTAVSNEVPVTVTASQPAQEIAHGTRREDDLGAQPAVRSYLLAQEPRASYEIVVDATSGDIAAAAGPLVEHVAGDGLTVLGSSAPVGTGPSRSLRVVNASASRQIDFVRVTSASCGTDCGSDDVYALRAYETTLRATRFNNSGSQTTIVLLQNGGSGAVSGEVHFWSPAGAPLAGHPFTLGPRELLVLSAASLPQLSGQGGSITISHDGPHGTLAGKAVAIEPATGFSFDTPFTTRVR
jgi:hypothetical protein